jgi:hypothetical protein
MVLSFALNVKIDISMRKIQNSLIAFLGLMTIVSFLLFLIVGGEFNSLQTFLFKEVSFLISPYSGQESISVPLFLVFLINLFFFSLLLMVKLPNQYTKIGGMFLLLSSIIGFILLQFPLDPRGISESTAGMTHIILILLLSLTIIISLLLFSKGFQKIKALSWLAKLSLSVCIIILLTGSITTLFALFSLPLYVGFFQKAPIFSFLVWLFLVTIGIFKSGYRLNK